MIGGPDQGKPGSTPIYHESQDHHWSLICNLRGGGLNANDSDCLTHGNSDPSRALGPIRDNCQPRTRRQRCPRLGSRDDFL